MAQEKKVCNLQIRYLFSITHVVQLMVSKINLFCQRDIRRYPKRDIGRKIPNFIPCQEAEKIAV